LLVPLSATASGPAFGMMYASAGSWAASSGAGSAGASVKGSRPAAFVAQWRAKLGGAEPAAQQAVGGIEGVLGGKADLGGVALDRLDRVALGIGIAARSFSSALRICAS
jgi:hypothetical protein